MYSFVIPSHVAHPVTILKHDISANCILVPSAFLKTKLSLP